MCNELEILLEKCCKPRQSSILINPRYTFQNLTTHWHSNRFPSLLNLLWIDISETCRKIFSVPILLQAFHLDSCLDNLFIQHRSEVTSIKLETNNLRHEHGMAFMTVPGTIEYLFKSEYDRLASGDVDVFSIHASWKSVIGQQGVKVIGKKLEYSISPLTLSLSKLTFEQERITCPYSYL